LHNTYLTTVCDNTALNVGAACVSTLGSHDEDMSALIKSIAGVGLLLLLLAVLHALPFKAYPFGNAASDPNRDHGKPTVDARPDAPWSPWRRTE
jgi:hypothetical protein